MYPNRLNSTYGIFIHQLNRHIHKKGIKLHVISPVPWTLQILRYFRKKWDYYYNIPLHDEIEEIEVNYPRYFIPPQGWLFQYSGVFMYRGLKNLIQNKTFDLIHAHVALPDGYTAYLIKNNFDIPFIVTVHGQDLQVTLYKNKSCKKSLKKIFDSAERITLVSSKLKDLLIEHFGHASKSEVIPNGFDPNDIAIRGDDLKKIYGHKLILLSVSNLINTKGIDLNIKAVKELKNKFRNFKYLIIGDGPQKSYLKKLVQQYGLTEYVEFLGRLPYKEVMKYMSVADIFSLPSWQEGFGVVYIEAMAHGLSVIGVEGEGIQDVIKNWENGVLVKPKDVNSLVRALEILFFNPQRRKFLGENAKKEVFRNYTWDKIAERYIEIYREVKNANK